VISVVFGAHNRLNTVTNQTALYPPAPGNPAGASAGMLRTFMCPGAIAPASPIILSFGHQATDADLPRLAVIPTHRADGCPPKIEPQTSQTAPIPPVGNPATVSDSDGRG
jgi:hypothetical protein